jgi:hypothetical protein
LDSSGKDLFPREAEPMQKFYYQYNGHSNSYCVYERGRTNQWGEPYCVVPHVSRAEAEECTKSLNAGREAWAWLDDHAACY